MGEAGINSGWIREPEDDAAVVFIHGIFSDGKTCWTHENGTYWPELLLAEEQFSSFGIYVYSYQTDLFSGSYSIGDIVDDLKLRSRIHHLTDCKRIIFVCHSMGGIVARKYLVSNTYDLAKQNIEIGLFLVASPSLGSDYATSFKLLAGLIGNVQVDTLRFVRKNQWLEDLDKEFQNMKERGDLNIRGQELIEDKAITITRFLGRKQVVEPFSGRRYFGESYKVPGSDHFSIAKPGSKNDSQHQALCLFMRDFVETRMPYIPTRDDVIDEGQQIRTAIAPVNEVHDEVAIDVEELRKHPLLDAMLNELETLGTLTFALCDAVLALDTPPEGLKEVLQIVIANTNGFYREGCGEFAIDCIDRFDVGYEAVALCLEEGALDEDQRKSLGLHLSTLKRTEILSWAHDLLIRQICEDGGYSRFLDKHIDYVVLNLSDQMTAYLLVPYRDPCAGAFSKCNLDSFILVAKKSKTPQAFIRRMREWIQRGEFDHPDYSNGSGGAGILYSRINSFSELEQEHPLQELRTVVCERVVKRLKSNLESDLLNGLHHLYWMYIMKYIDFDMILDKYSTLGIWHNSDVSMLLRLLCDREHRNENANLINDLAHQLDVY